MFSPDLCCQGDIIFYIGCFGCVNRVKSSFAIY